MLDKKQIRAVFLFEFKMGCKAAEAICNINSHLAQELLMNIQCSGGSRSFAKAMIALKMRIVVAGHGKLNNDQCRWRKINVTETEVNSEEEQRWSLLKGCSSSGASKSSVFEGSWKLALCQKPCVPQSLSHVQLSATPWNGSHQAPLSMEFPRQKYRSG